MAFVDDLRSMPAPGDGLTCEQRRLKELAEMCQNAVRRACIDRRADGSVEGFLIREYDSEYCQEGISFIPELYSHAYPYKVELKNQCYFRNASFRELQICRDGLFGSLTPVDPSRQVCAGVAAALGGLLSKDGFQDVRLDVVPVYATEVKRYVKSSLFSAKYFEEGTLAASPEGYAISIALGW